MQAIIGTDEHFSDSSITHTIHIEYIIILSYTFKMLGYRRKNEIKFGKKYCRVTTELLLNQFK